MRIRITGKKLPKHQSTGPVADPNDAWIRKILEYEASKGSATGTGLSNWGYNSRNPRSIDEAMQFFRQDYLPKVQDYPMGLRERAADFMYNTGVDPRIYMLDQYIIQNEKGMGLPGRLLYKEQGFNSPQFERVYSQYQSKIDALPIEERVKLMDAGKDFYYRNINMVDGKPNPAYDATWQPRVNMWGTYSAPVTTPVATTNASNIDLTTPAGQVSPITGQTMMVRPGARAAMLRRARSANVAARQSGNDLPFFPELNVRPVIDEATIDRPPLEEPQQENSFGQFNALPINPSLKRAMDVFNRNNKINLQTGFYDPKTALDKKLEQLAAAKKKTTITNQQTTQKPRPDKEYNYLTPTLMNTGLGVTAGILQNIFDKPVERNRTEDIGATDSLFATIPNTYSRGRNEINTGAFAPNQMTPVQFAGRPTREYYGFAQDGLSITGDVLGLSELYSDPESYKEPVIPVITQDRLKEFTGANDNESAPVAFAGEDDYVLPVQVKFKMSSGYGPRRAPIKGASTFHNGLDMGIPINTDIFSIKDGVVKSVWYDNKAGGGKSIIIEHSDGSRSGYAHLNDYKVKVGDRVSKGQRIALSGNTGRSTGPHLHFTYRPPGSSKAVDPRMYFNFDLSTGKGTPQKAGGPDGNQQISMSHNNPLNLHYKDMFAEKYGAVPGSLDGNTGERVAMFNDVSMGIQANVDVITNPKYRYKPDGTEATILEMRNRWVNGDHNEYTPSADQIVKAMGKNYKFSELTPEMWDKLFKEFARWEGKQAYNYVKGMNFTPYFQRKLRYQEGGEYELSEEEIQDILQNGGEIEFL